MGNKPVPIPEEMSIEEAADFWDEHSVTDYPSRVIELPGKSHGYESLLGIDREFLPKLQDQARKSGVPSKPR